jgi:hypothetical protein
MSKVLTPPQYTMHHILAGMGLRYKYPVSTTLYRSGGVWFNVFSPGMGNPDWKTQVDVEPTTGMYLYFNTPITLPDVVAALLPSPLPLGDPTWTPGTLA